MSWPKLDRTLADQILRYARWRSGSSVAQVRLGPARALTGQRSFAR